MDKKIQLKHPANKKGVSIDKEKYDILKEAIMNYLRTKGESTHSEILHAITDDFRKSNNNFEGSLEWHLEWVKLDLEARSEIKRTTSNRTIKFMIAYPDNK